MSISNHLAEVRALAASNGLLFEHYPDAYAYDVVSCVEAARARGVFLSQELKHLLLETPVGNVMAHLPGDRRASLRKIKRCLGTRRVRLSAPESLAGAKSGTICPFVAPFLSYRHLIDESILARNMMTTNDTTLRGYLRFDPQLILLAERHDICEIKAAADTSSNNANAVLLQNGKRARSK